MVHRLAARGLVPVFVLASVVALLGAQGPAAAQEPNCFAPVPGTSWQGGICFGQELPLIGDFNGDGADDVAVFVMDTRPGGERGAVWVALSTRASFGPLQKWAGLLCIGDQVPLVGDFNGDGRDDVAVLLRDSEPEPRAGDVYVALSNGAGFDPPTKWQESFCAQRFTPLAADVDGDGRCDLLAFVRSTLTGAEEGDVYVALSEGDHFAHGEKWHDFMCIQDEQPIVGDFNGDGRADIGACVSGAGGAWNAGAVYVALSEGRGHGFGASGQWLDHFSHGHDQIQTGDVNGDGKCDLIAFPGGRPDPARGAADTAAKAYVSLSDGARFASPALWHPFFCVGEEVARAGDFNGDHRCDIATFVRDTAGEPGRGDVFVALAAHGEPATVAATPNAPRNWRFRANRMRIAASNESGDEPYFVAIGFRSRFATPGSTRTFWAGGLNAVCAEDLNTGGLAEIPPRQGELTFDNVTLMQKSEMDAGGKPEVIGVVLIALEHDSSDWGDMVGKINSQMSVWRVHLADLVERAPGVNAQAAADGLGDWLFRIFSDSNLVEDYMLQDDDDHVGNHLFLWVAAEPDCTQAAIHQPTNQALWPFTEGFLAPSGNHELGNERGTWVSGGANAAGNYIVDWTLE